LNGARLLQFGLTLSSAYGATFYTIGCHAAHVFGAVIWLLIILAWPRNSTSTRSTASGAGVWHLLVFGIVADVVRYRLSVLSFEQLCRSG
jgi:heme/copper-type cytochrome/quinol oxidase subunit 3